MEELASVFQNKVSLHTKPNFSDLPLELVGKIVKETDLPSRLALWKVSIYLRALVDKQTPRYKNIGIVINSKRIQLDLEGILINYTNMKYDKCAVGIPGKKPKMMDRDNMDVMFDDLMTFMSNPSFYVEHLKITTTDDASYEKFITLHPKLLRSKIEVKSLWMKVNMDQELRKVSDFIDRSKVQKFACHWLEEESRWNLREYMELVVREGDNFVGEQSYVISQKDDLPWMKKYGKKKKEYEESLQPSDVVKWDVHWPKRFFI